MRVLVTGASGFIGRRVVMSLAANGYSVRAMARSERTATLFKDCEVDVLQADVLDPESLSKACKDIEAVIHLAAIIRELGEFTFQRMNLGGTIKLLNTAAAAGVQRFVMASAIGASSDPSIPYLYSRWRAEQEVINSPIPSTILRFSVGFGRGDEFFNTLAALAKLSPLVPIAGDGKSLFQPIAADDAAKCLAASIKDEGVLGKTIELGGPAYFTYDQMIDTVAGTLGLKIAKLHIPIRLFALVTSLMGTLLDKPPVTTDQLKMLDINNTADVSSVGSNFGFEPMSLEDNIGYIKEITVLDALKISMGNMPTQIRDH